MDNQADQKISKHDNVVLHTKHFYNNNNCKKWKKNSACFMIKDLQLSI